MLGQYWLGLFGIRWYWASIGWCCSKFGGTGLKCAGSGWYLVVLGQYRSVLIDTCGSICWYLVALDQYKAVMVDP